MTTETRQAAAQEQLTQQLLSDFDARTAVLARIRSTTAGQLAAYHTARQAMAAGQRRRLNEQADRLRRELAVFLDDLNARRRQVSAAEQQRLRQEHLAFQEETERFLQELQADHQTMSRAQRQELSAFMDGLQTRTIAFLDDLATSRRAMAAQQQQRLSGYFTELQQSTAALLHTINAARQAMAGDQRQRLAAEVAAMRRRYQEEAEALQRDQQQAGQIWRDFSQAMQERRTGKAAVTVEKMPGDLTEESGLPPAPREARADDDLTTIRGIGGKMQRLLNDMGISTYDQLAVADPEELRIALGEMGRLASRLARVEVWIAEAQRLTLKL